MKKVIIGMQYMIGNNLFQIKTIKSSDPV